MAYRKIIFERKDGIARITFNRPEVLNAMDEELLDELVAALGEVEKDDSVGVLIIMGAGRAFSAGRDIKSIGGGTSKSGGSRWRVIEDMIKPSIVAVHGYCYTGAIELAMCADIIIASDDAVFADTHARFGLIPGGGQTQRLPRQIGAKKAKELLFTCDRITAAEAERIGLVNRVVPRGKLEETAVDMAQRILKNVPESIRAMKSLINLSLKTDLDTGLRMETERHLKGLTSRPGEREERVQGFLKKTT